MTTSEYKQRMAALGIDRGQLGKHFINDPISKVQTYQREQMIRNPFPKRIKKGRKG